MNPPRHRKSTKRPLKRPMSERLSSRLPASAVSFGSGSLSAYAARKKLLGSSNVEDERGRGKSEGTTPRTNNKTTPRPSIREPQPTKKKIDTTESTEITDLCDSSSDDEPVQSRPPSKTHTAASRTAKVPSKVNKCPQHSASLGSSSTNASHLVATPPKSKSSAAKPTSTTDSSSKRAEERDDSDPEGPPVKKPKTTHVDSEVTPSKKGRANGSKQSQTSPSSSTEDFISRLGAFERRQQIHSLPKNPESGSFQEKSNEVFTSHDRVLPQTPKERPNNQTLPTGDIRSAFAKDNTDRWEQFLEHRSSVDSKFSELSKDCQDRHKKTGDRVTSLDEQTSALDKRVEALESLDNTALKSLQNDINATKAAVGTVKTLADKQDEASTSISSLEMRVESITTSLDQFKGSVPPETMERIDGELAALTARVDGIDGPEGEHDDMRQTLELHRNEVQSLKTQISPEAIGTIVNEAILTSARLVQAEVGELSAPTQKNFEDMAHKLTEAVAAAWHNRMLVEECDANMRANKSKFQDEQQDMRERIDSLKEEINALKQTVSEKNSEAARQREELTRMEKFESRLKTLEAARPVPTPPPTGPRRSPSMSNLSKKVVKDYKAADASIKNHSERLDRHSEGLANLEGWRKNHAENFLAIEGSIEGLKNRLKSLEDHKQDITDTVERSLTSTAKKLSQQKAEYNLDLEDKATETKKSVEKLETDLRSQLKTASESLVDRMETKIIEATSEATIEVAVKKAVNALKLDRPLDPEDIPLLLETHVSSERSKWLQDVKVLIAKAFNLESDETKSKLEPLFEKLYQDKHADCERRLREFEKSGRSDIQSQHADYERRLETLESSDLHTKNADHEHRLKALENTNQDSQTKQTPPAFGANSDDYIAPEDHAELRRYTGKTRFDVDTMQSQLQSQGVDLRNLRRNFEISKTESNHHPANQSNTSKNIDKSSFPPASNEPAAQVDSSVEQRVQQVEQNFYDMAHVIRNHAAVIGNTLVSLFPSGSMGKWPLVLTPPNMRRPSEGLLVVANNAGASHHPQSFPLQSNQTPPSPISPPMTGAYQGKESYMHVLRPNTQLHEAHSSSPQIQQLWNTRQNASRNSSQGLQGPVPAHNGAHPNGFQLQPAPQMVQSQGRRPTGTGGANSPDPQQPQHVRFQPENGRPGPGTFDFIPQPMTQDNRRPQPQGHRSMAFIEQSGHIQQ